MNIVKLARVNECLQLVATLPGDDLNIVAGLPSNFARHYSIDTGLPLRTVNAIGTLVRAGILRGPWLNANVS